MAAELRQVGLLKVEARTLEAGDVHAAYLLVVRRHKLVRRLWLVQVVAWPCLLVMSLHLGHHLLAGIALAQIPFSWYYRAAVLGKGEQHLAAAKERLGPAPAPA